MEEMEVGCIGCQGAQRSGTGGGGEIMNIQNNTGKLEKTDILFLIIYKNFLEAQNTSND